ncbi:MAG: response regulator transcription factor [Lachnospiraceae bacterium]|nr:response regulator transcription factor [Lachnospiraceae bacterium]
MKIAVCDDETVVCRQISDQIRRVYPSFYVQEFYSGEELLKDASQFQIIFLDIRLGGMNGIETARQIRKESSKTVLVFLTAVEEYVFQAFDVEALHYLLKPLKKEKFFQVMELAVKKAEEGLPDKKKQRSIIIKAGAVTRKIEIDEIIYAEIQNRKVTVHTAEGKLEYYGKLSELLKELGENFICPHRSYLVNFAYVSSYCATSITLDNGAEVFLAKQRYKDFVKQYLQYLKRQKNRRLSEGKEKEKS